MRKITSILICCFAISAVYAQKAKWDKGGVFILSANQVGNYKWQVANPENKYTIAGNANINAFANKKVGRYSYTNNFDAMYGSVISGKEGQRKLSDRVEINSRVAYQPKNWCCNNLKVALHGQARTQFANGYDYDYFGSGQKRRTSGFFAPAIVTLSPGIEWTPVKAISVFASPVAGRWTIVTNAPYSFIAQGGQFNGNQEKPLANFFGVDAEKEHRVEFGSFITARANNLNIANKIKYFGRLDFNNDYLRREPLKIDIFMNNTFVFPITKNLAVTYNLDFLYDDDIVGKDGKVVGLQALSIFGVGYTKHL